MHYKPKRLHPFRLVAKALRGLVSLLSVWPLLLVSAFFVSPVGPHLLWDYLYEQRGSYRFMHACRYIGSRGFVYSQHMGECPYVTIIDQRTLR